MLFVYVFWCLLTHSTSFFLLQVKRCADAGADIVRITVQGKKEAEACMKIREQLFKDRWGLGTDGV
jgi:(E)-4-hydroxy-3-methylbut-2-enyl-diphosphate synthase